MIMANCHVAHDVKIGDNNNLTNDVTLAGHVEIGSSVTIHGFSKIQPFVKVGDFAYLAGKSVLETDVPPFCKAGGDKAKIIDVNSTGLERAGYSAEAISKVKALVRQKILGYQPRETLDFESPEVLKLLEALGTPSRNGIAPSIRENRTEEQELNSDGIPCGFYNLPARHGEQTASAWSNILKKGNFINGAEVKLFEEFLCRDIGASFSLGCSNGTDALTLALLANNIGPGDGVIVPSFTFIASASSIARTGATPIFVDIDPNTLNISPSGVRQAIELNSKKIRMKGIVAVNLFGQPCEYDELHKIAEEEQLFIVEDAAQSYGARYKDRRSGTLGDLSAFSFYPTKPLGGTGDGGAVISKDESMYQTLHSLANHGINNETGEYERLGLNARLDTVHAAALLAQVKNYNKDNALRRAYAFNYEERLAQRYDLQVCPSYIESVYAQFSIRIKEDTPINERLSLIKRLSQAGIETRVFYSKPLHLQPAFKELGYQIGSLPVSEDASQRIICLPIDPYSLDLEKQDKIISILLS